MLFLRLLALLSEVKGRKSVRLVVTTCFVLVLSFCIVCSSLFTNRLPPRRDFTQDECIRQPPWFVNMVGFVLGTLYSWIIRYSVVEFRPKRSQPCPFLCDRWKMEWSWMHPWMNDVSHGCLATVEESSKKFDSYLEVWNLFGGSFTRCHATIIFIIHPRLHSTSFHISYIKLNENRIIEPAELAEHFVRTRTRSSGRAHQEFF